MLAEVEQANGRYELVDVKPPEHVYCDTCGDCIICSPHGSEPWCETGGRWVIYKDQCYQAVAD